MKVKEFRVGDMVVVTDGSGYKLNYGYPLKVTSERKVA